MHHAASDHHAAGRRLHPRHRDTLPPTAHAAASIPDTASHFRPPPMPPLAIALPSDAGGYPLLPPPFATALPYPPQLLALGRSPGTRFLNHRVQAVQRRNPRQFNPTAVGMPRSNSVACGSVAKQCKLRNRGGRGRPCSIVHLGVIHIIVSPMFAGKDHHASPLAPADMLASDSDEDTSAEV